jgi:hypothetical protein
MEQNDDWQTQNRYMQIEGFAEPADKIAGPQTLADNTQGGLTNDSLSYTRKLHHIDGRDHQVERRAFEGDHLHQPTHRSPSAASVKLP